MAVFVGEIQGTARRYVDLLENIKLNELKIPESYIDFETPEKLVEKDFKVELPNKRFVHKIIYVQ